MPFKQMEVREQRVEFVVRALRRTERLSDLCREFGISRPTGYQWIERYQAAGVAGIEERSRRPRHSPTQTAPELEARIVSLRQLYPDWGARKLGVLLGREGIELPSSTVHRVLLRHGLVRDQDRQAPVSIVLTFVLRQSWRYEECMSGHVRQYQSIVITEGVR